MRLVKTPVRVTKKGSVMLKVGLVDERVLEVMFQRIDKGDDTFFIVKPVELVYDSADKKFSYVFHDGRFLSKKDIETLVYELVNLVKG